MNKIRALIVDDSSFMRTMIKKMLTQSDDIEVVGSAVNGREGVEKAIELKPDIITMDIEMPIMNGLEAVAEIMKKAPTKILMLSTLTTDGATETLKALELGAVDFIPKDIDNSIFNIKNKEKDLLEKIKRICANRNRSTSTPQVNRPTPRISTKPEPSPQENNVSGKFNIVAIGASTGGPKALNEVIPLFPKSINYPILLVQHMPKVFTGPLAKRLNDVSSITVKEAEEGEMLRNGFAYVAQGEKQMTLKRNGKNLEIRLTENIQNHLHCPSVDVMMSSVAEVYRNRTLGIMMTGMGRDGLEGFRNIKKHNGITISQNKDSCVVYGMPRAVSEAGLVDKVVPLERITQTVISIER